MWAFQDKGRRDVCLIPEVTGLIQELWRDSWSKTSSSRKIFYLSRCYRYERPQKDRYREFTQFGVEILGRNDEEAKQECIVALRKCLDDLEAPYRLDESVKRGLSYYTDAGFEAVCEGLGAQKQIAGGGAYAEGIGWAIGVDRLISAINTQNG